jgi:hypothetical protein
VVPLLCEAWVELKEVEGRYKFDRFVHLPEPNLRNGSRVNPNVLPVICLEVEE